MSYFLNSTFNLIFFLLTFSTSIFSQKGFSGHILYEISTANTSLAKLMPITYMHLYTNDTIARIENDNPIFGKQITIKHLELEKSYLLLEHQGGFYAIQTPSRSDSLLESLYNFDYKCIGTKKIAGRKTKKVIVGNSKNMEETEVQYFKNIRPDLLDVKEGIKGLPAIYSLITKDGELIYKAILIEEKVVNRDLFGIPSNYKKLSLKEFLDLIKPVEN
jgi:hypothetical protein